MGRAVAAFISKSDTVAYEHRRKPEDQAASHVTAAPQNKDVQTDEVQIPHLM